MASFMSTPPQHLPGLLLDTLPEYNCIVIPITSYPSVFNFAATTELSTPPDIATTTLVFFGSLFIPNEFIIKKNVINLKLW